MNKFDFELRDRLLSWESPNKYGLVTRYYFTMLWRMIYKDLRHYLSWTLRNKYWDLTYKLFKTRKDGW